LESYAGGVSLHIIERDIVSFPLHNLFGMR